MYRTILGSCVSVCLWDQRQHVGGLNHYVLPRARDGEADCRFGDVAIARLIDKLRELGCRNLAAKVFGGASVMQVGDGDTVGQSNTRIAVEMLEAHRIPIIARRTGGANGIVLRYLSATGQVLLREIAGEK